MSVYNNYKAVIGLECHVQLLTQSKMYSNDEAEYGGMPNGLVSAITLGHPGTLPVVNTKAIEFAVKLGIATHSQIDKNIVFARKNYFYADLPKGYQITQDAYPICTKGFVDIKLKNGTEKTIHLTRIHLEEDSGKSIHDIDPFHSLINLNRAGTPLLEIVTEPDFTTGEEAYAYLTEIKKIIKYLDVCNGNMEEGSLRCDANISVMKKDATVYGKKVEVKNMNSFRNVERAIDFEIKRQIDLLELGKNIDGETRSFDAVAGNTFSLRSKENANDYRYFPEPDLSPIQITQQYIDCIKQQMPTLPNELIKQYKTQYHLSDYDAHVLTELKEVSNYYNEVLKFTSNYKSAANWVMGPVKSFINERALTMDQFEVSPQTIANIIELIDTGKINNAIATQKLFPAIINEPSAKAIDLATKLDILQQNNTNEIEQHITEVLQKYSDKVTEYKNGKVSLLGLFVGEVIKLSKGKADPKLINAELKKHLEK